MSYRRPAHRLVRLTMFSLFAVSSICPTFGQDKTKSQDPMDKPRNVKPELKKAYKDWDDVVTDDVQISTAMQSAIKESDIPADILYYLGENPDEAERILELPAGKQALAIGKIEAKLEKSDSNKSGGDRNANRQQSRAPDPIKPTSGNGGKLKKTYEEMSYGEFAAARARETRGGNRQRII